MLSRYVIREDIEMKKRILAALGAVVLTLSMTMTAFATPSTEAGDSNITDKNGQQVANIKVVDNISSKYDAALAGFDGEVPENYTELKDQEVVKVGEGEVDFPITIALDKDDFASKPVIFAYIDGAWKKLDVVDGGDTWKITVPCETVLKFFVEKAAAGKDETPKTGDSTSFVWVAVALAAAATAVVASKKRTA